jgi:mannosyltransferase
MAERHTPSRVEERGWFADRDRVALMLLVATAALLRFVQLDQQPWLDEISAIQTSLQRSPLEIMTVWPGATSHVLFDLLASVSIRLFGNTPFAARLPAALFGVAGVWVFARLALRLVPRNTAWVVSALFALSYHHIFFSQNARGYSTLIFFFLLATDRFLALLEKPDSTPRGFAYAITGSLAAYAQPFGAVIVPGQFLALCVVRWFDRDRPGGLRAPLGRVALWSAGSMLLTAALYAPFVSTIFARAAKSRATPAEGPKIGLGLLLEVVEGFHNALLGVAGLAVAAFIGVTGLYVCLRSKPIASLAMVSPLLLQVVLLGSAGMRVHPRYFAIALPLVYLFGGVGLVTAVHFVFRGRAALARPFVLAGVILASAVPLLRYYETPKQDFVGAMRFVDSAAAPGDRKAAIYLVGHVIAGGYYGRTDYRPVETLQDLLPIEQEGRRVWAVTTLERILLARDSALWAHIRSSYTRVAVLPGTVGDGAMRIYRLDPAP